MTTNFNVAPYYDDFDETKNHLKIMFKPGFAVQSRELTQIQSTLQNQISKFGNHIFKDGSIVMGGNTSIVDLNSIAVTKVITSTASIINATIIGGTSGAKGIIYLVEDQLSNTIQIIYYKAINGINFIVNESVSVVGFNNTYTTDSDSGESRGYSVDAGVFYVKGHFVYCESQSIIIDVGYTTPHYRVGLNVIESFSDATTDESLNDPAQGSYNYAAPGADRYNIDLQLTKYPYTLEIETRNVPDFIELGRIVNGELVYKIDKTIYSEIEKTLARRTYDESGDYTVRQFNITVQDHIGGDSTKLSINLSPGKAYVRGYEFETIASTYVDLPKARDVNSRDGIQFTVEVGQSFNIATITGAFDFANGRFDIKNAATTIIGYGYSRGLEYVSAGVYKMLVFGVVFDDAYASTETATISTTSGFSAVVSNLSLSVDRKPNLVQTPDPTIQSLYISGSSDTQYVSLRYIAATFASGISSLVTGSVDEVFVNSTPSEYVVITSGGVFKEVDTVVGSGNSRVITLVDLSVSGTVSVFVKTGISNGVEKQKTISSNTVTDLEIIDTTKISIGYSDIISISSVFARSTAEPTADSVDVTNLFDFNNGQTIEVYDHGWLSLKSGKVMPAGYDLLDVTFTYAIHSSYDGYFSVDSYTAEYDYDDIPILTDSKGTKYDLRNCLDFRPVRDSGVTTTTFKGGKIVVPDTIVSADYTYYLSRIDKLAITKERVITLIKGIPATVPTVPDDIPDAMVIYIINVPAYTSGPKAITYTYINNRRYTMRDIGKIDKRVTELVEYTALALLEKSAKDEVLPSGVPGIDRFKNGILVDSFAGHGTGEVTNPDYKCSIDTEENTLRPLFNAESFKVQPASISGNAKYAADDGKSITVGYTPEEFIANPFATNWVNVNPYMVFNWKGIVTLNPPEDPRIDIPLKPEVTANANNVNDAITLANRSINSYWKWWKQYYNGGVANDTLPNSDSIVSYTKPAVVTFAAKNMKPNTVVYAIFDSFNVTKFCSVATKLVCSSTIPSGAVTFTSGSASGKVIQFSGNQAWIAYDNSSSAVVATTSITFSTLISGTAGSASGGTVTSITDTNELKTDVSGEIAGFLVIPDSGADQFKFKTGSLSFKLIDDIANINPSTIAETTYISKDIIKQLLVQNTTNITNTTNNITNVTNIDNSVTNTGGGGGEPPQDPPVSNLYCNESASGGKGVKEYIMNFDAADTTVGINIHTTGGNPVRYTITWKGIAKTTGFVGTTAFDSKLATLGYPKSTRVYCSELTFSKTSAAPTTAQLKIEAPVDGAQWSITTVCTGGGGGGTVDTTPKYSVTPNVTTARSGAVLTYTIVTANVATGTTIHYMINSGDTLPAIYSDPDIGTCTIGANGRATFTVNISTLPNTGTTDSLIYSIYLAAPGTGAPIVATAPAVSIVYPNTIDDSYGYTITTDVGTTTAPGSTIKVTSGITYTKNTVGSPPQTINKYIKIVPTSGCTTEDFNTFSYTAVLQKYVSSGATHSYKIETTFITKTTISSGAKFTVKLYNIDGTTVVATTGDITISGVIPPDGTDTTTYGEFKANITALGERKTTAYLNVESPIMTESRAMGDFSVNWTNPLGITKPVVYSCAISILSVTKDGAPADVNMLKLSTLEMPEVYTLKKYPTVKRSVTPITEYEHRFILTDPYLGMTIYNGDGSDWIWMTENKFKLPPLIPNSATCASVNLTIDSLLKDVSKKIYIILNPAGNFGQDAYYGVNAYGGYMSPYFIYTAKATNTAGGVSTYIQTGIKVPTILQYTVKVEFTYVSGDDSIPVEKRVFSTTANGTITVMPEAGHPMGYAGDPIAQSFFITGSTYPDGVVIDSLDVFFKKKSESASVIVELREVTNGYPTSSNIAPLATGSKSAAEVVISSTGSSATNFKFNKLVHLLPGEYAFVVIANTNEYELFTSVLGEFSLENTNQRVTTQPVLGSMFKSQNASTWTPVQEEDVKFKLYKCAFDTTSTGTAIINTISQETDGDITYDVISTTGLVKDFANSNVEFSISTNSSAYVPYQLESEQTQVSRQVLTGGDTNSLKLKAVLSTNSKDVAPIINTNNMQVLLIQNLINDDTTDEELYTGGEALSKYITRPVKLSAGFEASDIKVILSAKLPLGASVKVYYKVSVSTDPVFGDNVYTEMVLESQSTVVNTTTKFVEYKYKTVSDMALPNSERFDSFAVKLVLLSSNPVNVPEVRDLRVLALDE